MKALIGHGKQEVPTPGPTGLLMSLLPVIAVLLCTVTTTTGIVVAVILLENASAKRVSKFNCQKSSIFI